jgi:hypothetical protein
MNVAWKSASNCARSYEQALSKAHIRPQEWKFGSILKSDHVYDSFIILSLLEDHQARQSTLVVPHTGEQKDRFTEAMKARNALIRLYSQPEIRHFCDLCIRVFKDPNGKGTTQISFKFKLPCANSSVVNKQPTES